MNVGTISQDATFFESEFSMKNTPNTSSYKFGHVIPE
jgi:hypothetical protein